MGGDDSLDPNHELREALESLERALARVRAAQRGALFDPEEVRRALALAEQEVRAAKERLRRAVEDRG